MLCSTDHPGERSERRATEEAARTFGLAVSYVPFTGGGQLARALSAVRDARADGLVVFPEGATMVARAKIAQFAIAERHLAHSMKYAVGVGGFTGARTETVIPPALNDPPGVRRVLFDLTLTESYPGTFADIGITVFGHALNAEGGPQFGHEVQFADTEPLAGKNAGTYLDLQIDLDQSVGPYRAGESFNDIFGPGPTDLTVTSAFQFFINKNVDVPITVYIDNVRLVSDEVRVPEPATVGMLILGTGLLAAFARRRRHPSR